MTSKKYQHLEESDENCTIPVKTDLLSETVGYDGVVSHHSRISNRGCVISALCLFGVLFLGAFYFNGLFCGGSSGVFTFQKPISGMAGVTQTVIASVDENYVEYYIEDSVNLEKTWILDDFNKNLQVMKSEIDDYAICYIVQLNLTEAVRPVDVAIEKLTSNKHQFHSVLTPDTHHVIDRSILGVRGSELCTNTEVYWLRPMEDLEEVNDLSLSLNTTNQLPSTGSKDSRSKRNIRECHTSCCWLVCCCDVQRFRWEASEYFTCRHVCQKCSPNYKSKIQRICSN